MTIPDSIILGIVQGLTELLPVSSSAHLVIVQNALPGFTGPAVLFDAILHLGTLVSIVFFFRSDIIDIVRAFIPSRKLTLPDGETNSARRRTALHICVGTVLTGIIGFLFRDTIHSLFKSVEVAASMLLVTGLLLFLTKTAKQEGRKEGSMNITDGVIIGLVQALALIPGISRSGSTIAFGIFRGLDREVAAKFSFLLSIPAVLGAVALEWISTPAITGGEISIYVTGFLTSALIGFLSLRLLSAILKRNGLHIFAYYCWTVGAAVLILS